MCSWVIETSSVFPKKYSAISEISGNLRKCSEMSGNDCLDFGKLLENLWKTLRKPSKKKKPGIINSCLWCGISLLLFHLIFQFVHCAYSWDMKFNTRREIPYLRAPMYYTSYVICNNNLFHTCKQPQLNPFIRHGKFCLNSWNHFPSKINGVN